MVFFSSYISWLSLSRGAIAASQNYRLVRETILQAQHSSEAAGANFLLVYVPSKSHVYLPYLNDPETVASVLKLGSGGFRVGAEEKRFIDLVLGKIFQLARMLFRNPDPADPVGFCSRDGNPDNRWENMDVLMTVRVIQLDSRIKESGNLGT